MLLKLSEVFGRGIAPMIGKSIVRIFPIEFIHDPIAGNLGQDAGGRNAETDPVTPDQRGMINGKSLDGQAIHESVNALMSVFMQSCQSARHCDMSSPQDIQVSNFL